MKEKPNISIIIPTFNRAAFIAESIDSLKNQTVQPNQIIVVNDGSTDHTKEMLEPHVPEIEFMETPQSGKSAAINKGLKLVRGDYLWIFDDDDVALPDALERLVAPLQKFPEFDYSFSSFYFTQSNPDHSIGPVIGEFAIPDLTKYGPLVPLLIANYLGGAAIFARTSVYDVVGQFDERLLRSQDYEMAIRIVRNFKGYHVTGKPTFHYRQHSGDRGNLDDRFKIEERNKKWQNYDQLFFGELYHDLELPEYLPDHVNLSENKRQAYIQRMAIMGVKNLRDPLFNDLQRLTALNDASPLNSREKEALKTLITFRRGSFCHTIYDDELFFREFNTLSESRLIRMIRKKLVFIIWKRCITKRIQNVPSRIKEALERTCWMYF